MDFRLTWTVGGHGHGLKVNMELGGHGLQVDMDRGRIDFASIQFYPRNIGGH